MTLTATTLTVASGVLTGTDSFIVTATCSRGSGYRPIIGATGQSTPRVVSRSSAWRRDLDGYTLNNYGTATWTGNGYYPVFNNGTVFNNLAGAELRRPVRRPARRGYPSQTGSGAFNNAGSFTKSAGTGTTEVRRAVR